MSKISALALAVLFLPSGGAQQSGKKTNHCAAVLAGVFAMMVLMTNASAATSTCPLIGNIKQTPMADGGYSYETAQPDGRIWRGENPLALATYLNDFAFHDARYNDKSKVVTCTYEGAMNDDASISIMLEPISEFNRTPTGDWRGTYCEAFEVSKCSFTHQ